MYFQVIMIPQKPLLVIYCLQVPMWDLQWILFYLLGFTAQG